jgi:nicotinate dehydrogenase subunit A
MPTYTCRINGRTASIQSWDPDQPILYLLRNALGLTGTKPGCGLGQCGACTILLDNQPVRACVTPVSAIDGRRITTVEGVGTPGKPDPLKAAFVAEQAAQCGYCTSGMIMAARALLRDTPNPTMEQAKQALAGNLCRCGTYPRVLRAIMRASGQRP